MTKTKKNIIILVISIILVITILFALQRLFMPKYMSDKIYAANTGTMYYHTFPSADHGLSYVVDPERYKELTNGMAEKYLKHSIRKK